MFKQYRTAAAWIGLALLTTSCANLQPQDPPLHTPSAGAQACVSWYDALDSAVRQAGVADAGAHRVAGFPYLRVDRLSASFAAALDAAQPDARFADWADRLRQRDLEGRSAEIRNLPPAARAALGEPDADRAVSRTDTCSRALLADDLAAPARRAALLQRARVPDDYSPWMRYSGIYAVARWPFAVGVAGWQRDAHEMFRRAASGAPPAAPLRWYVPAVRGADADTVQATMRALPRDALGIPRPDAAQLALLFDANAPTFAVETSGPHDRPGRLRFASGGQPEVDTAEPVVYRRAAHTRLAGQTLLQLVYTIWFSERPPDRALDILAGPLDGVVLRVTLDEHGAPLVWDTIHPCGCYHMFLPTARLADRPAPAVGEEWLLVPHRLQRPPAATRPVVRIAARSHHLVALDPSPDAAAAAREPVGYRLLDEDSLRTLAWPTGGTRSLYGPDGLVQGSERLERLLLWPMGVASPGTMRQWGRHPTAFLGRRHFDDADLLDLRFDRLDR